MFRKIFALFGIHSHQSGPISDETERIHRAGLLLNEGEAAAAKGDLQAAISFYERAIDLQPNHSSAHYKLGNLNKDTGRPELAIDHYDRAISINPSNSHALCNRGVVLAALNRLEEALQSYDRAIGIDPRDALVHFNRGILLRELGRRADALLSYERATELRPDYVQAHCNRAKLLKELNRLEESEKSYDRAVQSAPGYPEAHFGRGTLLQLLNRPHDALADYDRALSVDPNHAGANANRAVLLMKLERWAEAGSSIDCAIAANPNLAEAHLNRGTLFVHLKRWPDALASLDRAIDLKQELTEAHLRRGDVLKTQMRLDAALASYDRALALDPHDAEAHARRADLLILMRRVADALESYEKAIALDPKLPFVLGMRSYTRMNVCEWSGLDRDIEHLRRGILEGGAVSAPFPMLALVDDEALHRKAAEIWVQRQCPPSRELPPINPPAGVGKLRIGYFSCDLHEHAVATLMAQVIEMHDRERFEVIAFSCGPNTRDQMRRRLELAFDRFLDVHAMSDRDAALLARSYPIDIAVDLSGYTGNARTGILAHRAAPTQVSYLGFPGTMAAEYMDYLIVDTTVVAPDQREFYAEKLVYLPHSYLPNDSSREADTAIQTREQHGLPTTGFVYCCFNNSYKLAPQVFEIWMRILRAVPQSVLWLSKNDPTAAANLRKEAARRGVDPGRLVFADRVSSAAEHLARYRVAGLFLDTLPYNAHATSMDALWAGCPVLTRIGKSFAGRVAASLLNTLDMPELVTTSAQDYERLAVELAIDSDRLSQINAKLLRSRSISPLFDTTTLTRHLEQAYRVMAERCRAGLPTEHIHVGGR
jgi:protein O-GlcNAc transferase